MVASTGTDSLNANAKFKVGYGLGSVSAGLTATAGGVQATALQLVSQINQISVCATTADAVKLPLADIGMAVVIANDGAAAAQVFGAGTDTIDAVATATGVPLTNAKRAVFYCTKSAPAGTWVSLMGVKSA